MASAALFGCSAVVEARSTAEVTAPPGRTRVYYIGADEVLWNYAPHGRHLAGLPGPEMEVGGAAGSTIYLKSIYREYTNATFTNLKPRPPRWRHLGILGPLIRAEVGDTVQVVFKNNTHHMCNMHPHGLEYSKGSEGALYSDGVERAAKKGSLVPPGGTYTYTWRVPGRSGPGPHDGSSILWMYHGHFMEGKDINSGLIGPIIVTARGRARADGSPVDVDREFVTAFAVFDESNSWYFEENLRRHHLPLRSVHPGDIVGRQPFLIYTINGLIEGNLPILTMKRGERVRWYLFASSNDDDVHTPHWHGETVLWNGMRTDTVELTPMGMAVADMIPENPGTWLFHCHNNDHMEGGMVALFRVLP